MSFALVLVATASLHTARLYRANPSLRRASLPLLTATDDDDWDASWQRVIADGQRRRPAPAMEPELPDVVPRRELKTNKMQQVIDVRNWRLPFSWFSFIREVDLFGTLLFTTSLAWGLFYLVVVPTIYVFGPALGVQAIPTSSGLIPIDLQLVASAVFIPAWPGCLLVAAGVRLQQGNPFTVDD